MRSGRTGILGGTFDPIHCGHVDMGLAATTALELTTMFVVTAETPPHRPPPVASSYHRFAMASMSVAGISGWRASDIEMGAGAQSFTTSTLKRFHELGYDPGDLFFVIGADAFLDIGSWKDYPAILDGAHFAVVSRPGCTANALGGRLPLLAARMTHPPVKESDRRTPLIWLIDAPTADVSSTAIRRLRAEGMSIAGLVPPAVQQHIEQHELYTSMTPRPAAANQTASPAAGRLHGQD